MRECARQKIGEAQMVVIVIVIGLEAKTRKESGRKAGWKAAGAAVQGARGGKREEGERRKEGDASTGGSLL